MKKFSCAHCGHRLAVQPRHLGKLVTCPECGRSTHPLATEILAHTTPPAVAAPATAAPPADATGSPCENCGQPIGKLQKPHEWDGHVVCGACHRRLSRERAKPKAAKPPAAVAKAQPPPATLLARTRAVGADVLMAGLTGSRATPAARVGDGGLRVVPLQWKHKLLVVLLAVCFAGAAVYGALTLLRDLAGLLTTAALVLLGVVGTYLILCTAYLAGKRILRAKRMVPVRPPAAEVNGRIEAVVVERK